MLLLPNSTERYFAALRLYVQSAILRDGLYHKHYLQLKKILTAEALYHAGELNVLDIISCSNSLLGAAALILMSRGISFSASFKGKGVYLINRRLFTAVLLETANGCKKSGNISVNAKENEIVITINGCKDFKPMPRLIKALGGTYFRELDSENAVISLPAEKTELTAEAEENEWDYIANSFSSVNIYLNNYGEYNFL